MNILFICMDNFTSFRERGTYVDIMRQFIKHGNNVFAVSPTKTGKCDCICEGDSRIIKPMFQSAGNYIKKGISVLSFAKAMRKQIDKDTVGISFDAIIYATPPITIASLVNHYKKRDNAVTYLLLKDIWPQVMVDVGLLTEGGIKGIIYRYFRSLEKKLYSYSDKIGCMSQANADYLLKKNSEISPDSVHVSPNSLEPHSCDELSQSYIDSFKEKHGIPTDKKVFLYGGNLGIMQGVPFFAECLEKCRDTDCCFVICGFGTHYHIIEEYIDKEKPANVVAIPGLKREEFDKLTGVCDVGLAFLDWCCTTPNFPSKILPYMEYKKPVIICADENTDIGSTVSDNGFGWYCPSNDSDAFKATIESIIAENDISAYGDSARKYLDGHFTAEISYNIIKREIENTKRP